ncbi:MAG: BrnA antitoxin family protein [Paracoccaceae bacterium]|nr:BrnA antitoxin family protein [Paracoccaceae bacterium]
MIYRTPRPKKGPKSVRLAEQRLTRLVLELNDEPMAFEAEWTIPETWATLEDDIDVEEKKVKITLRLDESVVKFFRAMGPGYQARMNRVLATYAQMKIAQVRWFEGSREAVLEQIRSEARGRDRGGLLERELP